MAARVGEIKTPPPPIPTHFNLNCSSWLGSCNQELINVKESSCGGWCLTLMETNISSPAYNQIMSTFFSI